MSKLIISVSGLRGVIGETLTPEVAMRYVAAYSAQAPAGPFIVTRDGRPSGRMLAEAVHAGLHAAGRSTVDAGIAATPTLGVLIRDRDAAGGIQISASHNPVEYNGLKLFSGDGRVIPKGPGQQVLDRYTQGGPQWVAHDRLGEIGTCADPAAPHLKAIFETVDVERIRARKYRVLLDSNRASGSLLGRGLLETLGCVVTVLGERPDGQFEHTPEPTAENLQGVCAQVVAAGADIGFCQDPDADRLAVIDAAGRYLGEEYTLALCVDHVLHATPGPVVMNCASSRMTEDICNRYGVPIHRAAVGEANVVDRMLESKAVFGGEGNGGPIDPRVGLVRDSFVGMAQLLDMMAARDATIADLADALPRYEIVKTKIQVPPERVAAALDSLEQHFGDARANRQDGLRLDWSDRWLLVRASNTEPIVRAIAEAESQEAARRMCEEAARVIGS